jgi:hypothetical protein
MNKDTVVGILGAVILVAAMVGIFYYEGTQSPSTVAVGGTGPFAVTWKSDMTSLAAVTGQSPLGQGASKTVNVSAMNLTKAEFTLTWTNDPSPGPGPNHLTLAVKTPDGRTFNASSNTGTVTVSVTPINPVPSVNRTGGNAEADAQAALASAYTATNGTGTWTVTVTYDAAEGQTAGLPLPPGTPASGPLAPTDPMSWSVTPKLTTYSAQVQRA